MLKTLIFLCFVFTLALSDLRSDFNQRVEIFINDTLNSNSCSMYEDLIKLEFSNEFCGEKFLSEVLSTFQKANCEKMNQWLLPSPR